MRDIIFILTIFPSIIFGQAATFSADTTRFYEEKRSSKDICDKIMEAEWRINGQTLYYGSQPVTIKTDNVLDTIMFRQRKNSQWDTIICNINRTGNFRFYYNMCCGAFDIADETGNFIVGSVIFRLHGKDNEKIYLGTLGETGLLVKPTSRDTLQAGCRSVMSPNMYQLTFSEIEICKDTLNCNQVTCLYVKGQQELNYEFRYRIITLKLNCLFLPLSNEPIRVTYDLHTDKVRVE